MKNIIKSRKDSGFTIIEVMIVLAIAGLIMVIVFIAVPQLQRNQRDNARQSIANRVKAEIETYAGNNQGQYPFKTGGGCGNAATATGCWSDFYSRYISGKVNIQDPSTGSDVFNGSYTPVTYGASLTLPANAGDWLVVAGAKCSGENVTNSGSASLSSRNYAVLIGLDRAGTRYCVDNG